MTRLFFLLPVLLILTVPCTLAQHNFGVGVGTTINTEFPDQGAFGVGAELAAIGENEPGGVQISFYTSRGSIESLGVQADINQYQLLLGPSVVVQRNANVKTFVSPQFGYMITDASASVLGYKASDSNAAPGAGLSVGVLAESLFMTFGVAYYPGDDGVDNTLKGKIAIGTSF